MNKNKNLKNKMVLKYWGVIVFFQIFSAEAQSIVHNTGLNVIYQGFPNKLLVSNPKIKRENLEIFCKDAKITDSLGDFYILMAIMVLFLIYFNIAHYFVS